MSLLQTHLKSLLVGFRKLSRYEWAFVAGLVLPLAVLLTLLKKQRVVRFIKADGFFQILDIFKTDIFVYLFIIFFGLLLFLSVSDKQKKCILMIAQAGMALFAVIEISSHSYFTITGFPLDFQLLRYTVLNFNELTGVMGAESDGSNIGVLLGSVAMAIVLPWLSVFSVNFTLAHQENLSIPENRKPKRTFTLRMYFLVIAMSSVILLAIPDIIGASSNVTRNLFLTVLDSFVTDSFSSSGSIDSENWQVVDKAELKRKPYSERKNLVFILFESTRASATSLDEPTLNTTPFLKELSKKSLFAKNAFAIVSRTSKSLVSIHCGIEPNPSMQVLEANEGAIPAKCLPELLNEQGYKTAYFQTAWEFFENRRVLIRNIGHTEFFSGDSMAKDSLQETNYFGYEDKILLKPSKAWLEKRVEDKKPFMTTYLTNTPHHQYVVPYTHGVTQYAEDEVYNRYLNTVHYTDAVVKEIVQQYIDLGLYQKTIFVILADHGEAFWEHDYFGHSNVIYDECIRIPLLIHDPTRFKKGRIIQRPVSQLDILPTVVDLLGYRIKNNYFRGKSILKSRRNYRLFMDCWHEEKCAGFVDQNSFKFVHHFGKQEDEYFNLKLDPEEKNNLLPKLDEEKAYSMKKTTLNWYKNLEAFYASYTKKN